MPHFVAHQLYSEHHSTCWRFHDCRSLSGVLSCRNACWAFLATDDGQFPQEPTKAELQMLAGNAYMVGLVSTALSCKCTQPSRAYVPGLFHDSEVSGSI